MIQACLMGLTYKPFFSSIKIFLLALANSFSLFCLSKHAGLSYSHLITHCLFTFLQADTSHRVLITWFLAKWKGLPGVKTLKELTISHQLLRSRLPRAPTFTFSRALYPFPTPPHTLPSLPTTSRALLTICSIFPALLRDLPFLVVCIPGLYLVRIPAPCHCHLVKVAAPHVYKLVLYLELGLKPDLVNNPSVASTAFSVWPLLPSVLPSSSSLLSSL